MPDLLATDAIIIDTRELRDNSSIVDTLTPLMGCTSFLIYGPNSKTKTGVSCVLERFSQVTLEYTPPKRADSLPVIYSASLISYFDTSVTGLRGYAFLSWWLEIMRHVSVNSDDSHENTFDLTSDLIAAIRSRTGDDTLAEFIDKMLTWCGLMPSLNTCRKCGSPHTAYIDIPEGNSLCPRCASVSHHHLFPIDPNIKNTASVQKLRQSILMADAMLHYHLGLKLHSASFLMQQI